MSLSAGGEEGKQEAEERTKANYTVDGNDDGNDRDLGQEPGEMMPGSQKNSK